MVYDDFPYRFGTSREAKDLTPDKHGMVSYSQ